MRDTATYSPEDNKLRLSPFSRLDEETYKRVKEAGFIWAPKQKVFVAPKWTPEREDLLIELCGEIDDEDKSLVARAEDRAERFEGYSENREADADRARAAVSAIADGIPLGQPILVGHHSERHARKDAQKIENGMRKAVKMWETAKYWDYRAKACIRHAKYKELPAVRVRRIKTLEADKRRWDRYLTVLNKARETWAKVASIQDPEEQQKAAVIVAGRGGEGCNIRMPRKDGDREGFTPDAYDVLDNRYESIYAPRTLAEVIEAATNPARWSTERIERWINHYTNRIAFETAMLADQGKAELLDKKPRPKQLPLCNYRAPQGLDIENEYRRGEMLHYPQIEMTQAEYSKIYDDYKRTRVVGNSHRVRLCIKNHDRYVVFLTDSKVHEIPASVERNIPRPIPTPTYRDINPVDPKDEEFKAIKQAVKDGVQVVAAPQLFPTPPAIARQMVEAAELRSGICVLEPSAGTGNLVQAILDEVDTEVLGYEINPALCSHLSRTFPSHKLAVRQMDFLEATEFQGCYERIIMNPPFKNGEDIKHIEHAKKFLAPGGVLVALCANGPRQQDALRGTADEWEVLPPGSFKDQGTMVNVAILKYTAPKEPQDPEPVEVEPAPPSKPVIVGWEDIGDGRKVAIYA